MSYKLKSFLFLSCFISTFAFYSYRVTKTNNTNSDETEIAVANLDKVAPTSLKKVELK